MASRVPARPLLDEEPAITPQLGFIASSFCWWRWIYVAYQSDNVSASTTDILTYEAWRQSKDAREIISRNFSLNIDDLFTLLFTNSKFFYDFQVPLVFSFTFIRVFSFTFIRKSFINSHMQIDYFHQAERKTSDIVQCPWQHSDQSEDKFREVVQNLT